MTQASNTVPPSPTSRSIKLHLIAGLVLVVLVVGGVGGWAAKTEIAGAVIAAGSIVVDSNVKKVQHQAGGTVGEILVHNGDRVQAGDVLVKLDTTIATARLAIVQKRALELMVRQAQLWAERDGAQSVPTPDLSGVGDTETKVVLAAERRLFELRKRARHGQKQQLRQRIGQLEAEVGGLTAQVKAKVGEMALMQRELDSARILWGKKLMSISRITALEREATRLEGQRAQLVTRIAATKGRIAETELQIIQIDRDLGSEVARELRQIDAALGELVERQVASQDQLRRMTIRAPQTGLVHQSKVHTVGGVVGAGETVMLIVPTSETLTIEAQVAPQDIDQLWIGQQTLLRFSAFNQRTTPELEGRVDGISADITVDEKSGKRFYTARVSVSADQARRLGQVKLVPGMPVETFIKTGDRTVMSYLMKPLADQANRAFRE